MFTLLHNGLISSSNDMSSSRYPSKYIDRQFRSFFTKYNSPSSPTSLLSCLDTTNQFFALRNELLYQNTRQQRQINKSVTTVILPDEQPTHVKVKKIWQSAPTSLQDDLIIHAPYENRLRSIRPDIRQLWSTLFTSTNVLMTKLIIGTRQRRNVRFELVRTCSSLSRITLPQSRRTQ